MRKCEFDECDRKATSYGLCTAHRRQQMRGKALTPIRKYRREENGYKECSMCEETKPVNEYYIRESGWIHTKCKACLLREKREQAAETRRIVAEYEALRAQRIDVPSGSTLFVLVGGSQ